MQSSFWMNLVPKPWRKPRHSSTDTHRSREWNPSTFFIVMFLLIGSNAIQMIALKKDFAAFTRKTDAKLGQLKEIIERIQRGEAVDVAGLLGTGDAHQEREWDAVIHDVEQHEPARSRPPTHVPTNNSLQSARWQPALAPNTGSGSSASEAEVVRAPPGFF